MGVLEILTFLSQLGGLGTFIIGVFGLWKLGIINFGSQETPKPSTKDVQSVLNGSASKVAESIKELLRLSKAMYELQTKLHDMHDQRDEDGVPIWWNRKSQIEATKLVAENSRLQTEILQQIKQEISELRIRLIEGMAKIG